MAKTTTFLSAPCYNGIIFAKIFITFFITLDTRKSACSFFDVTIQSDEILQIYLLFDKKGNRMKNIIENNAKNHIRPMNTQDASRVAEILIFAKRAAYRPIFRNDYVSFQEMSVLDLALSYRDDPKLREDVFVYDDGIVRGMISIDRNFSIDEWRLKELYVDPFFQRQGIGTTLMQEFLTCASSSGSRRVSLWVLEANSHARGFYESFGWRPSGRREQEPGTDQFLLLYQKTLT